MYRHAYKALKSTINQTVNKFSKLGKELMTLTQSQKSLICEELS